MRTSRKPSKAAILKSLRNKNRHRRRVEVYDVETGTLSSDDLWQKELDSWLFFCRKTGIDTSLLKDLQDVIRFYKIPHPKEIKKKHKGEFWTTIAEGASEYATLVREKMKDFLPDSTDSSDKVLKNNQN